MSNPPADAPRFLRTEEAARFLGLSHRTLEKHRSQGTGPSYRKLGGRVVYTADDLNSWIDRSRRIATTDTVAQRVPAQKRILAAGMTRPFPR